CFPTLICAVHNSRSPVCPWVSGRHYTRAGSGARCYCAAIFVASVIERLGPPASMLCNACGGKRSTLQLKQSNIRIALGDCEEELCSRSREFPSQERSQRIVESDHEFRSASGQGNRPDTWAGLQVVRFEIDRVAVVGPE